MEKEVEEEKGGREWRRTVVRGGEGEEGRDGKSREGGGEGEGGGGEEGKG